MSNLQAIDTAYVAGTYKRFPVEITSGKGSIVYDTEGKRYIDMGSGIGVTAFGIADEGWMGAVTRQLSLVQHMSNLYYTEPCARLAEHICTRTGMKKVFFCNSGAEANEGAIKTARKYSSDKYGPDRYEIITLVNSFHGRTISTLAACGQETFVQERCEQCGGGLMIRCENRRCGELQFFQNTKCTACGKKIKVKLGGR